MATMLRLRVEIPDRTGSLAVVTQTLAAYGADVAHLAVMHRGDGIAVDDIWLSQAAEPFASHVVGALQTLNGIRVLGCRVGAVPVEFDAQLDFLAYLFAAPQRSVEAFVEMLPAVTDADWAVIRDDSTQRDAYGSHVDRPRDATHDEVMELATPGGMTLLVGRGAGLPWHPAEVRRLVSVLELSSLLIAGISARVPEARSTLTSRFGSGYTGVSV